jgi:ribosomal protein S12 methylthiotransferase
MRRFHIHRLGCPKNDVDADFLAGFLMKQNMVPVDDPEKADLLIVNTCGFIRPAKEESIEAALTMTQLKNRAKGKKLILTGCLSQRYGSELAEEIPELDGVFGINDFANIKNWLDGGKTGLTSWSDNSKIFSEYSFSRILIPEESFGYIKISDGCDNRCSYCAIPDIRGPLRSRRIEAIAEEAAYLLDNGKKELILVCQEGTAYGRDLYGEMRLLQLLDRLSSIDGYFWIRVMYMHPARLTEEVIDYMIDNPKICSYFDIPLQHINDRVLAMMNRQVGRQRIEKLLDYVESRKSDSAVRTAFIAGFPGETDSEFEELYEFVEERRFDRMGVFEYSLEDGTPAAALPGQIEDHVRRERHERLMLLQQDIAFERNEAEVGRPVEVLVDKVDNGNKMAVGRTQFDAPEIDQVVRLGSSDFGIGEFVNVAIDGFDGYDLLGRRR